tara:strand:+ start:352 stop:831 length:480 start_codon:yes stop_codon:yes gene_type:complete
MNSRIYERNVPSSILEPSISPMPSYPRHEILPMVGNSVQVHSDNIQVKKQVYPIYNVSSTFNPGDRAPWSGYVSNVNTESMLRNQIYPYSKCNDKNIWVPDSNSGLYHMDWKYMGKNSPEQKNEKHVTKPFEYSQQVGYSLFNNSTRQQIRDIEINSLK